MSVETSLDIYKNVNIMQMFKSQFSCQRDQWVLNRKTNNEDAEQSWGTAC